MDFKKIKIKIDYKNSLKTITQNIKWWRALTHKEELQIRETIGNDVKIKIIPNGINIEEIDNYLIRKAEFQQEESNFFKEKESKKNLNFYR